MNLARRLYQLQQVELEIEAVERAQAQINNQLADSRVLDEARVKLASEKQRLEELKHEQHSAEWELEDLGEKLASDRDKLYSGRVKNSKELTGIQHEFDGLKARYDRLEEKTLGIMEQVEQAEAGVTARSGECKKLAEEKRLERQKLSAEMEQLGEELADLRKKRERLSAGIDQEALELYLELKKHKGTAVARVEQGVCRGCGLALSSAWLQRARGGELVRCSGCSRILFLE